jgi:hypothetical protein
MLFWTTPKPFRKVRDMRRRESFLIDSLARARAHAEPALYL